MADIKISREQLQKFLPDFQSIRAFEQLFTQVQTEIPDQTDGANESAATAVALVQSALVSIVELANQLSDLLALPVVENPQISDEILPKQTEWVEPDDINPRPQLGTIASQNAEAIEITGGSISGTSVSAIGDIKTTNGDFSIETAGNGLRIKTAANARAGQSTLVAGTVTVNNTSVTANTRVLAFTQTPGGTVGALYKSAAVVGTSFTITSTSAADTSTFFWFLIEIQ
jgi:hypothetical protein